MLTRLINDAIISDDVKKLPEIEFNEEGELILPLFRLIPKNSSKYLNTKAQNLIMPDVDFVSCRKLEYSLQAASKYRFLFALHVPQSPVGCHSLLVPLSCLAYGFDKFPGEALGI